MFHVCNIDLSSRGHGISHVNDWLISKASKTLYVIATDGLIWVLCKFEEVSSKARPIHRVDLKPIFTKFLLKVVLGAPRCLRIRKIQKESIASMKR
jgi:hypothetical protein